MFKICHTRVIPYYSILLSSSMRVRDPKSTLSFSASSHISRLRQEKKQHHEHEKVHRLVDLTEKRCQNEHTKRVFPFTSFDGILYAPWHIGVNCMFYDLLAFLFVFLVFLSLLATYKTFQ